MSESISGSSGSAARSTRSGPSAGDDREAAWRRLLGVCSQGDQSGLAALYDQSSPMVYGIALRMLGDAGDAEEVTLDVYHQLWRSARTYDSSRSSVTSWLVTLTRNRAIDRIRSRSQRKRNEEPMSDPPDVPAVSAGPDEAALAGERRKCVLAAMAALSSEQREAIELAFFSGLTHSELASRLGQPLGTVKTRIRLAMMKLREQLGEAAI